MYVRLYICLLEMRNGLADWLTYFRPHVTDTRMTSWHFQQNWIGNNPRRRWKFRITFVCTSGRWAVG